MRVSKLRPQYWVAFIVSACLLTGFGAAAIDNYAVSPGSPELPQALASALHPSEGRILIVGGSNAYFGIEPQRLAEKLNRPVFNLALGGAGGDERLLWAFAHAAARPGDIIILSLLSPITDDAKDYALAAANERILMRAMGSRYHPVPERPPLWHLTANRSLAADAKDILQSGLRPPQKETLPCQPSNLLQAPQVTQKDGTSYWQTFAAHVRQLQANHVTVIATVPWLWHPTNQPAPFLHAMEEASAHFQALGVPIIEQNISNDIIPDRALFCDSVHLNEHGAAVHTEFLARGLQQLLPPLTTAATPRHPIRRPPHADDSGRPPYARG